MRTSDEERTLSGADEGVASINARDQVRQSSACEFVLAHGYEILFQNIYLSTRTEVQISPILQQFLDCNRQYYAKDVCVCVCLSVCLCVCVHV